MQKLFALLGMVAIVSVAHADYFMDSGVARSAVSGNNTVRVSASDIAPRAASNNSSTRGNGSASLTSQYRRNQLNSYYMVATPDVDSVCRTKIFECLAEYCGDVTVLPGQRGSRCDYATEGELYNWTLICLQKDNSNLIPQYNTNLQTSGRGMNTAARLCPSYVQQELMSYLSMANMAEKLTLQRSSECMTKRAELEAAMTCHEVALSYGNETNNVLVSNLTDACGDGVHGGSSAMVQKFSTAGNVGGNIWGWVEKTVTLDLSKKGANWQEAMDSVLAGYVNRMNLACGENLQLQDQARTPETNTVQVLGTALLAGQNAALNVQNSANVAPAAKLTLDITSNSPVYDYSTAKQVIQAGLTNSVLTQNAFLTSAQMSTMQDNYKNGTKVFILRDSARCYTVVMGALSQTESALVAQQYASCVAN